MKILKNHQLSFSFQYGIHSNNFLFNLAIHDNEILFFELKPRSKQQNSQNPSQINSQYDSFDNKQTHAYRNSSLPATEQILNRFVYDEPGKSPYINDKTQQEKNSKQNVLTPVNVISSNGKESEEINSPEILKQNQITNPYLQQMQMMKERQQKMLEEQLRNQKDFNEKNLVVDSDV